MGVRQIIKYHQNSYNDGSLTNKFRKRRMGVLDGFVKEVFAENISENKRISILDIGGTYSFWKSMGFPFADIAHITLLNLDVIAIPDGVSHMASVAGDARHLAGMENGSFDLVFSNSCIEHVGKKREWKMMADEMQRVGKHYFLQTPNRYFPIEPHYVFPFFQFFPHWLRTVLIRCFQLGTQPRGSDWTSSRKIASEITLLRHKDLERCFPGATIVRERVAGLTKSFMVFR